MKKIIGFLLFISVFFLYSCNKQETVATFLGGTSPVLTGAANSNGSAINLNAADSSTIALVLKWTNPNYQYNYGVNSLNVNYLVEIDTLGSNFTNPKRAQISISQSVGITMTESYINSYLSNQMGLDTSFAHKLQIRVTASITTSGTSVEPLYSNILSYTAKPYYPPPVVNPPASGALYLVGSATAGGWSNPVPTPTQQFTKVNTTTYTLTVSLTGGQEFLFIPVNGDWSHKFACNKTTSAPNGDSGGVFGYDWSDNFPGPTSSGTYKIVVDFQHGTYSITKQ